MEGLVDKAAGLPPKEEDARARAKALKRWTELAMEMVVASPMLLRAREEGTLEQSISDALAARAESTLRARYGAIRSLSNWAAARGHQVWPMSEALA